MAFNSFIFIFIFLPITVFGYFFINGRGYHKLSQLFLILMSFYFVSYLNFYYLWVLIISILVNYTLGRVLTGQKTIQKKKVILILSILLNVSALVYFKYTNFFIDSINSVFLKDYPLLNIFLPLGISFYSFSQISYLIDIYRDNAYDMSFLEYALYISYFPKFIQGPIAIQSEMIEQFRDISLKKMNYENLSRGIYGFSLGLAKKVLIADLLGKLADAGLNDMDNLNGMSALVIILSYSLQLYFDFSGYCDMAQGASLMLNINLPVNFNSPYKADSISDFWDRWHMSLTKFFTKYLYIPLGGSRRGRIRTLINIMIVFLISGLWHGSAWTFVLWGALHGICMVTERYFKERKYTIKLPNFIKTCVTFSLVNLLWSLFRADSLANFFLLQRKLYRAVFFEGGLNASMINALSDIPEMMLINKIIPALVLDSFPGIGIILVMLILLFVVFFTKNVNERIREFKPCLWQLIFGVFLLFWSLSSLSNITSFLYSNF